MDDLQPTQQLQRAAFAVALSDRPLSPHYPALIPAHSRQLTATGRLTCPHLTEHSPVFSPSLLACYLQIVRHLQDGRPVISICFFHAPADLRWDHFYSTIILRTYLFFNCAV